MNKIKETIESFLTDDNTLQAHLYIGDILSGAKYEITSFETEFDQASDFKGQPQHEVKGGLLQITINQSSDELIDDWMFNAGSTKDGVIIFTSNSGLSGIKMSIYFKQGKCILYDKLTKANMGIYLSIAISASEIKINDVEHTNYYMKNAN